MLGALTYHAIAAMTRDRLAAIEQTLLAKIRSQNNVSALERQVYFLARTASESMSLAPHLPTETSLPRFARSLSLHAVLGSSGPTIPKFAAMFAPSQRWLFDTVHGGNPDPNRQRVLAGSTDFLVKLAERGTALINASDVADKPAELRKLRAYLLGHTCHIAADLVSAPFVSAASWTLGDPTRTQLTPDQVAAAMEKAAAQLFRRDLVTTPSLAARGDLYKGWWLKPGDLPAKLFDAYKEALDAIYGPGARARLRPSAAGTPAISPQTSTAFWKTFESDAPPDLSVRLLEDGYSTFRSVMESSYVWNFGDWLAATAWIFFPPIAAYPLIVAMPHTRALFKDNAQVDGHPVDTERGWFGLVMAPLVTSALAPIVLSVYIAALTYFGVGRETVFGWVTGGVNLITSIIFLATIGSNVDPAVRWILLFILPFVGLLVHAIYVLGRGGSDPRHVQLALSSLIPCIITALYILFHLAWHQSQDLGMNGWLKETDGHREEWGNGGFIGGWILWAVLLIGGWLLVSYLLQPSKDAEPAADQFVNGRKHFLRLFGHSSLLFDPNLASNPNTESRSPTLATQYFPTDRRPLLKIWWTGGADLWMRSERNALQFSTSQDGTGNPQTVLATAAPMTASEFARFLNRVVKDGANFDNKLNAEVFDAEDFDYVLPPGDVFADAGDDKTTIAEHDTEAAKFTKLKTTRDDPTVVYHAARAHVAGFQGTRGAVFIDVDRGAAVAGAGQATFAAATVTGNAATRFATFFQRGDVIATTGVAAGDESRIVASVQDDQTLTVTMPFTAAVGGALRNYQRGINSRDAETPAGTLQETAAFRVYQGASFDSTFVVGDTVRAVTIAQPVAGAGRATFNGATVNGNAATLFTTFFQPGDIIATVRVGAGDQFRTVSAVANNSTLTVSVPFTAAVGGALRSYQRYSAVRGPGRATCAGTTVTGDANTRFTSFFQRGDVIATTGAAGGEECRIVAAIQNDRTLTVTVAFTAAVGGAPQNYQRLAASVDQQRTVLAVQSATQILLDKPLLLTLLPGAAAPPVAACSRLGRLDLEGFRYAPVSPVGIFAGESLMERAADLGALLCMGAASHTLTSAERQAVTAGADEQRRPAVNPVYQVFRNWNLSQRRVNEWQMLIGGGAVSEKRGTPRDPDPLQPNVPSGWTALTAAGEDVANQLGWVPLLERWLDVARRPGVNSLADEAFREGDPTNKKLSEGIAFLFDLPMPA